MTIVIQLKDFKKPYSSIEQLKALLQEEYSLFGYKPDIYIENEIVSISINDKVFESTQNKLLSAFRLCDNQQYDKAEGLLKQVIETCPLQADAYRTLAQIHMMQKDYETAIDYNIEALRIDPGNLWALILMGNILVRKGDVDSADSYYNKVLEYHPDDVIALNNVAANYMQRRQFDKAINHFERAIKVDASYMNTYYGLSVAYQEKGDLTKSFDYALQAVIKGVDRKENPKTREQCLSQLSEVAQKIVGQTDYMPIVKKFADLLEARCQTAIEFEKDNSLNVLASLQYATTHQRPFHKIVYTTKKPIYSHYLLHELTHLEMNIEASEKANNYVVYNTKELDEVFNKKYASAFIKFKKKLGDAQIANLKAQMRSGLCLQLMNCPIDLLVEDRIYKNYPSVRALQFMSLFDQESTNIQSVQQASKTTDIPFDIVRQNKVMNIVSSMHFKELFGVDLINYYKPTKADLTLAEDLYEEYKAYRDEYLPGEEYDLMRYFVESLGSSDLILLENEEDFKKKYNLIANKKADTIEPKSEEDKNDINEDFMEKHKDGANPAETMMMSMYMLGALQYFDKKTPDEIAKIAMEIAMVGLNGISPDKKGYKIPSIDKEFGGYEFLAFYYVSWALHAPEMLEKLGLPFKSAYETALQLHRK